jgi:hypothetical protein
MAWAKGMDLKLKNETGRMPARTDEPVHSGGKNEKGKKKKEE